MHVYNISLDLHHACVPSKVGICVNPELNCSKLENSKNDSY